MSYISVNKCVSRKMFPYLQDNKLACHGFIDANKKQDSWRKDKGDHYSEHSSRQNALGVGTSFSCPYGLEHERVWLLRIYVHSEFASFLRKPNFSKPQSIMECKQTWPTFAPRRHIIFIVLGNNNKKPALCFECR